MPPKPVPIPGKKPQQPGTTFQTSPAKPGAAPAPAKPGAASAPAKPGAAAPAQPGAAGIPGFNIGQAPYAYIGIIPAPTGMMPPAGPGATGSGLQGGVEGASAGQEGSVNAEIDAALAQAAALKGMQPAPRAPPGLNEAFLLIYRITTMFAAMIFALMVLYGIMDVLMYLKNEVTQRVQRTRDPNMFNKDTTDIKALSYITTNNPDDEPYSIFQQQKLIGYLFVIAGIMVIFLGIQLGTFFSLKLYAVFTQKEFKDQVDVPTKLIAAMVVMIVAALMIKGLYKKHFIKKVQASLRDLRGQLRDIRTLIYNNLSNNGTFLAALRTDNMDDIVDTIRTVLESKDPNTCMDKMSPCDGDVESMIFTLNLYSYLRVQVPDSDPNYDKISKMFEVEGVNSRAVDPTLYFYYKQPMYVPNLYPVMRNRIKKSFGKKTGNPAPNDYEENSVRERIFLVSINNKMQDLNRKLARMYNIASGKNKVRSYLFAYLFYVLFFAIILVGMFYVEAKPYLIMAWHAMRKVFGYVSDKAESVVAVVPRVL